MRILSMLNVYFDWPMSSFSVPQFGCVKWSDGAGTRCALARTLACVRAVFACVKPVNSRTPASCYAIAVRCGCAGTFVEIYENVL